MKATTIKNRLKKLLEQNPDDLFYDSFLSFLSVDKPDPPLIIIFNMILAGQEITLIQKKLEILFEKSIPINWK